MDRSMLARNFLEARARRERMASQSQSSNETRRESSVPDETPSVSSGMVNLAAIQEEARRRRGLTTHSEEYERRSRAELLVEQERLRAEEEEKRRRESIRADAIEEIQSNHLPAVDRLQDQLSESLNSYIGSIETVIRLSSLETILNSLMSLKSKV